MGRQRSEDFETDSVPPRVLQKDAVGPEEVRDRAIRQRHQWPGSTDGTILAPEAVGERHLESEVRKQLATSTVHHVTATAVASQDIAAGGATVQWGDEAGAPTEREGFEAFSTDLAAGSVGDIPIDRDGFLILKPKLQFEDASTEEPLDETGVDVTVRVQRTRDEVASTVRGALSGTNKIGLSGPIDCGDARNGDTFRVRIDPGKGIKCSGTIQAALWVTGQSADTSSGWTQVLDTGVWGLTQDDSGNWWTTEGASGETVTEYDSSWTLVSSFEQEMTDNRVRGITWDGTNLWITGADNPAGGGTDQVHETATDGTEVSEFTASGGAAAGLAWDGTDLWFTDTAVNELRRYDTSGTVLQTVSLPSARGGLAYHDGRLYLVDPANVEVEVRETDGTVVDTIDVSGATDSPNGVFVAADGTLYVTDQNAGVWRRD